MAVSVRRTSHAPQRETSPWSEEYQRGRGRCVPHLITVLIRSCPQTNVMSEAPAGSETSQQIIASAGVITLGSSE